MLRSSIVPVVLALAAGLVAIPQASTPTPASASTPTPALTSTPAPAVTPVPGSVVVASANLREGAVLATPPDLADLTDIRRFARRFAALIAEAPDVVALQEVRGSLSGVVRRLNQAMRGRATYVAVTRPGLSRERGRCDDHQGRFTLVRDGALVVNTATTTVLERGSIRTWGRWYPGLGDVMRRTDAAGCAEHPWTRVRVARGGLTRDAVVVGMHIGPRGHHLKNRAMQPLAEQARAVAGLGDLVVLAGDFNLPWCRDGARVTESSGCRVAAGHDALAARGFGDALRSTGAGSGSRGRVDFIHTIGQVVSAGWDRCYRPRLAPTCARRDSVFASEHAFAVCQRRAVHFGSPGGGCRPGAYTRYYSDHPIVTATLR